MAQLRVESAALRLVGANMLINALVGNLDPFAAS